MPTPQAESKPEPVDPDTLYGDARRASLADQKTRTTKSSKTPADPCGYVYYQNSAGAARETREGARPSEGEENSLPPTSPLTPASRKRKRGDPETTPASRIRKAMNLRSPGRITHGTLISPHSMMKKDSSRELGRAFKLAAPNGITVSVFGQLIMPYKEPKAIQLVWDDEQLSKYGRFLTIEPTYTTPTIEITYEEICVNRGKQRIGSQNSVMKRRLGKEARSAQDYLKILGLADICNIAAWGHALCYTFYPEHPAISENLTAVLEIANKAEAMISAALKLAIEAAHADNDLAKTLGHWTLTATNHRQEVLNTKDEILGYLENLCHKQVYTYTYYDATGKLINTLTLFLDPLDPNKPNCQQSTNKLRDLFLGVMREEDLFQIDTEMDVDSEEPESPTSKPTPRILFRSPQKCSTHTSDEEPPAKKPRMTGPGFFDRTVVTSAGSIPDPIASPALPTALPRQPVISLSAQ